MKNSTKLLAALACCTLLGTAHAEGPFRNPDNKNLKDVSEGTYPVPYKMPVVAEITEQLNRIRAYMDHATPTRVVNKKTGAPITDYKTPVADAAFAEAAGDYHEALDLYRRAAPLIGTGGNEAVTGAERVGRLIAAQADDAARGRR